MARRTCKKIDDAVVQSGFLNSFDYVLTDCDGVLWIGNDAIAGSVETMQALKAMGKQIIYLTNNSTKSRDEYLKKCHELGFPASKESIISTAYCTAIHLQSINFEKKVYIFGSTGIAEELDLLNIQHLPIGADPLSEDWIKWVLELKLDPEVGAVVVGFDQHVSFPKLIKASSYLSNPDVIFIATNRDEQFPSDQNIVIPGSGTFVSAVEVASNRKATVMGKPEKFMLDCVQSVHPAIDFSRTIMIGDRLTTDILLGTRHGVKTFFVETGINSIQEVRELEKSDDENDHLLVPDYYLPRLGDLLPFLKA